MPLLNDILTTDNYNWSEKFWCKPCLFREFTLAKEHLHLGNKDLTNRQFLALEKLIGTDPLKIFTVERLKHIGVYLLGKGSGKDYMASVVIAYLFYLLLCMKDMHSYFDLPPSDNIDILNIAPTAFQAKEVFFLKFKSRVMNWPWLISNYKVTIRSKPIRGCTGNKMEIRITDTSIETQNNLRFFSLHAEAGNFEGFNVLAAILDETSEFEDKYEEVADADGDILNVSKAELIYNTLRTSAESRGMPWLMIIISFPRATEDFTIRKYDEALKNPDGIMVAERGCTWEYNPKYYGVETYDWEQWKIPITLKDAQENDPINFRMKFCTVPPIVLNRFFYNDERIQSAIDESIEPLLVLNPEIEIIQDGHGKQSKFIIQKVMQTNLASRSKTYAWAIHIDLSIRSDSTVLVIGHGESCDIKSTFVDLDGKQTLATIQKKVVIDQIIVWEPNIKQKAVVGHMNVDEITDCLVSLTGCRYISWDQYQSQYVLEKAIRQGMDSESHNINTKDYVLFRNYLWAGAVSYPRHTKLLFEIERIIWDGKKPDHLPAYSKDVIDAVVGVTRAIAGGLARSQDAMTFTFCDENMFDPSFGQEAGIGMPNLPKEAMQNTGRPINPAEYGFFF